jgi:hypothetical protein
MPQRMTTNKRGLSQLSLLVAVTCAIWVWAFPRSADTTVWILRLLAPLVATLLLFLLIRDELREDDLPDLIRQIVRKCFERDGLCFAFVPTVADGICWMNVYYQNRFENACTARIVLQPESKSKPPSPLLGIDARVECGGGAFGVLNIPWPIPADLQGRAMRFEVGCEISYPTGRGKTLRYREGLSVGSPGGGLGAVETAALLLVGIHYISHPASLSLALPSGVVEAIPAELGPTRETLWQPDVVNSSE